MASLSEQFFKHRLKKSIERSIGIRLPPGTGVGPFVEEALSRLSEKELAFVRERGSRAAEFKSLKVIVPRWREAYGSDERLPWLRFLIERHEKGKNTTTEMHSRLIGLLDDPDSDHHARGADLRVWAYLLREFQSFDFRQIGVVMGIPRVEVETLYLEAYTVIRRASGPAPEAKGA